jgi:type II secretory ATPase GspE/PulE/Tfp pilus assembly ATPase PilB-like protein
MLGVLAQRLARRLCGKCKKPHIAGEEEVQALLTEFSLELTNLESWKADEKAAKDAVLQDWIKNYGDEKGNLVLNEAVGCDICGGTGYKGRVGLHELLVGTDALKKNIQEHARVAEMLATALGDGMHTLKQDGIEKVLMGITDMPQVRAVCIK